MNLWGILLIIAPIWFAVTIAMAIVLGRSVQRADREELEVAPIIVGTPEVNPQRLAS